MDRRVLAFLNSLRFTRRSISRIRTPSFLSAGFRGPDMTVIRKTRCSHLALDHGTVWARSKLSPTLLQNTILTNSTVLRIMKCVSFWRRFCGTLTWNSARRVIHGRIRSASFFGRSRDFLCEQSQSAKATLILSITWSFFLTSTPERGHTPAFLRCFL